MPDYNLGTGKGKIILDADTSGADEAAVSMAAVSAEGKTLQETMGKTTDSMTQNEQQTKRTSGAIDDLRSKHQGLKQRLQESKDATDVYRKAEQDLRDVMLRVDSEDKQRTEASNRAAVAKRNMTDATKEAQRAESMFRDELQKSNATYQSVFGRKYRLDVDSEGAIRALRATTQETNRLERGLQSAHGALDNFTRLAGRFTDIESGATAIRHLTNAIDTMRNAATIGLAGGGAGGFLGLLGGGGAEGITALVGSMSQLIGVVALLPGVLAGAGAGLGTLMVGFHGIAEALQNMGDPMKFVESIRMLAPAAQQALIQIQSFYSSFRGAMDMVQQSLIQPILQDIQPLVFQYLPMLMNQGMAIASVFGQAGHLFASWLETPATFQTIQTFLQNVAQGLQAALPAVQAFSNAFLTITGVGGGFFVQIGNEISKMANEFNVFISAASQSGALQAFIQTGITAWEILGKNIIQVGEALLNIFAIGNEYGGGFLALFQNIGQEFLNWTQSLQGQNDIRTFFADITAAGHALHPILTILGGAFFDIFDIITKLGVAVGPGLVSFFQSMANAIGILGPILLQSAPAFNEFLTALGQLVEQVMTAIGPSLPEFLQSFADAAANLVGPATTLAGALGNLLKQLTPAEITAIVGFVTAFESLGAILPTISAALTILELALSPVGLIVIGLGIAFYEAYEHSQTFRDAIGSVGDEISKLPGQLSTAADTVSTFFSQLWDKAFEGGKSLWQHFIDGMSTMLQPVDQAVEGIMNSISKYLPHSPALAGPFSGSGYTAVRGQTMIEDFASGMSAGGGNVSEATSGIIESIAGPFTALQRQVGNIGGRAGGVDAKGLSGASGGLTSAGVNVEAAAGGTGTLSGGGGVGTGGGGGGIQGGPPGSMSSWLGGITSGMSQWSKIFTDGFHLFSSVFQDIVKPKGFIDTIARLWNGGINPLTAPGGIDAGAKPFDPYHAVSPTAVPGVPSVSYGGPGVGGVPAAGAPGGPAIPGQAPVYGPPSPARPQAAPPGGGVQSPPSAAAPIAGATSALAGAPPITVNTDGTISSPNPEWQKLLTRESGGRNVLQGDIPGDPNTGPNKAQGYFQITPETWNSNGGQQFAPNPMAASPQDQATVAGRIFAARGGQPWGAVPGGGREDEATLRAGLTPAGGAPGSAPPGAGAFPAGGWQRVGEELQRQQGAAPGGLPAGTPSPESAMQGVNLSTIPVAVQRYANDCIDASARIILSHSGVNLTEDQLKGAIAPGTNIDAQAAGLNTLLPQGRFVAMQGSGGSQQAMFDAIKTSIDRGVGSILNVAPGSSIAGRNFSEGHFIAATGYNPDGTINLSDTARGTRYSVSAADAFQATQGRGIVAGTGTGPTPTGLPNVPPSVTTTGGVRAPSAQGSGVAGGAAGGGGVSGDWTGADTAIAGGGAALGTVGLFGIGRGIRGQSRAIIDAEGRLANEFPNGRYFGGTGEAAAGEPLAALGGASPLARGVTPLPPGQGITPIAELGGGAAAGGGVAAGAAASGTEGVAGTTAAAATSTGLAAPVIGGVLGAAALGALSTATGPLSGQESNRTPGVIYGPDGSVVSAGPRRPAPGPGSVGGAPTGLPPSVTGINAPQGWHYDPIPGHTGGQLVRDGSAPGGGPAGQQAPVPVNVAQEGGTPVSPGGRLTPQQIAGLAPGQQRSLLQQAFGHGGPTTIGAPVPAGPPNTTGPAQGPAVSGGPNTPAGIQGNGVAAPGTGLPPGGVGPGIGGLPQQAVPGVPQSGYNPSTTSPIDQASKTMQGVGSVVDSVMQSVQSVIKSIGAAGDLAARAARIPKNSEEVVKMIQDVQQFIETGAQIAKTVGDVAGAVGQIAGAAGPFGSMASGPASAVSAVAGLVSDAFEAVNAGISLGIEVYHQVGRIVGDLGGFTLGGAATGWLGGNVQELLNTNTGQLYTYSADNPLNKNVLSPGFQQAYAQTNANQTPQYNQLNVYAGPGQSTGQMMSDTMWMVNTSPATASAAGQR